MHKKLDAKLVRNKTVLVRVDFNVPLKNGKVVEDSRIEASLPTINWLCKQKARVVLLAHLGRPGGKTKKEFSLKPVANLLGKKIKQPVKVLELGSGEVEPKKYSAAKKAIADLKPGQVVMLENTRFLAGEESNDANTAQIFASLGDMFVFDGFAVAHRAAASVSGIAKFLPTYAGLLMASEVENLTKIIQQPKHPFVAIVGGAKMETKIPVIQSLVKSADKILVGGGVTNTMLAARGYDVGASICDHKLLSVAKKIAANKKIMLPVDLVVGDKAGQNWRVVDIGKKAHQICAKGEAILDIGPRTAALFANEIANAKSALWNGAVGWIEQSPYNLGTEVVANALATTRAFTVAGGGETIEVLTALKITKKINFVSTGGGAMLEFLGGAKLPGVQILLRTK